MNLHIYYLWTRSNIFYYITLQKRLKKNPTDSFFLLLLLLYQKALYTRTVYCPIEKDLNAHKHTKKGSRSIILGEKPNILYR